MTNKSRLTVQRSQSEPLDDLEDEMDTPVLPPLKGGGRLGNLFRQSASILERSPFFSITSHSNTGEVDPDNQRAMKIAFYNTLAFVFVAVIFYTCVQVFYILEFCIRPLLFAMVFGAVIYPLKQVGKDMIMNSLDALSDSGVPLLLGLLMVPFYVFKHVLLWLFRVTQTTYREMLISLALVSGILVIDMVDIIDMSSDTLYVVSVSLDTALEMFEQYRYAIWTIALGYLIFVVVWWEPGTLWFVEKVGAVVWLVSIATGITYLGEWRWAVALCTIVILCCGTYARFTHNKQIRERLKEEATTPGPSNLASTPIIAARPTPGVTPGYVQGVTPSRQAFTTPGTTMKSRYLTPATTRKPKPTTRFLENTQYKVSTEGYFSVLGWSVFFTFVTRDLFIFLQLLTVFLVFVGLYLIYRVLHLKKHLISLHRASLNLTRNSGKFKALCPRSVRGLGILMMKGQNVVIDVLRRSTNQVVSGTIVVFILLGICLVTLLVFYTVHAEVMYLLKATSYYINNHIRTSEHLQNLNSSLSAWSWGLSSVHTAGRSWIKSKISELPDSNSSKELEQTLLTLYDDMYNEWLNRNVSSTTTRSNVSLSTLYSNVRGNLHLLSLGAVKTNLFHLVSGTCEDTPTPGTFFANYLLCSKGVIIEVVNSLWQIISTNMTLVFQLSLTVASSIVEGGAAFLNFVVQFVIFITALYYLLLYSEHHYAPVEFLTSHLPSSEERVEYTAALFDATAGIFGASFKLSLFYGCYVWMTHSLFSLEIKFVPALLAAMLSVVPVGGVYWASLPGVLVLWLVDGRGLRAIVFMLLQILPSYIVDMAIYSEIKGGWHPYITGLAVVGGLYYFGLEGAMIGPLVICILKFMINLYESLYDDVNSVVRKTDDK